MEIGIEGEDAEKRAETSIPGAIAQSAAMTPAPKAYPLG